MKLLAILMCLCIERLINPGLFLYRFDWFPAYTHYLQNKLTKPILWGNFLGILVLLLPLFALAAFSYLVLAGLISDMAQELVAIIILIYCFGPGDTRRQVEGFITSTQENNIEQARYYLDALVPGATHPIRTVSEYAIVNFNQEIFAVLFWFICLGPLGALLYRLSELVEKNSQLDNLRFRSNARLLRGFLDWLPVRLLGFSFTLVGNFTSSFQYLRLKVFTSYDYNQTFLQTIALIAVAANPNDPSGATIDENKAILALFDRTLIIWLVAIALFTLGAWLY